MSRIVIIAGAVCALGCATTEFDRRADEIAAGEDVIPRVDPKHPNQEACLCGAPLTPDAGCPPGP